MLNGAGVYQALDARTSSSSLLQGMDYLVGLSGGNWMVGSAAVGDFATVPALRERTWRLQRDLVAPGGVVGTLENLRGIRRQVEQKERAGFATTITDYWGLALGRQLVERGGDGGVGVTWSGIREVESFRNGTMPFPIVVADGRRRGEVLAESNATVYEFSPFEFGTWDRGLRLFSPVEYLGTAMDGGQPRGGICVRGFDYAGFVMGTSSSLFNNIVADIGRNKSGIEGAALRDIVRPILEDLSKDDADIAEVCHPPRLRRHGALLTRTVPEPVSGLQSRKQLRGRLRRAGARRRRRGRPEHPALAAASARAPGRRDPRGRLVRQHEIQLAQRVLARAHIPADQHERLVHRHAVVSIGARVRHVPGAGTEPAPDLLRVRWAQPFRCRCAAAAAAGVSAEHPVQLLHQHVDVQAPIRRRRG